MQFEGTQENLGHSNNSWITGQGALQLRISDLALYFKFLLLQICIITVNLWQKDGS